MSYRKLEVNAPDIKQAQWLFVEKAHELGLDVKDVYHSPIGIKQQVAA